MLTKHYSGDQIKADGMSRTCGMYRGEEKYIHGFGVETQRKESAWKT
jgi:hypothetical protein